MCLELLYLWITLVYRILVCRGSIELVRMSCTGAIGTTQPPSPSTTALTLARTLPVAYIQLRTCYRMWRDGYFKRCSHVEPLGALDEQLMDKKCAWADLANHLPRPLPRATLSQVRCMHKTWASSLPICSPQHPPPLPPPPTGGTFGSVALQNTNGPTAHFGARATCCASSIAAGPRRLGRRPPVRCPPTRQQQARQPPSRTVSTGHVRGVPLRSLSCGLHGP